MFENISNAQIDNKSMLANTCLIFGQLCLSVADERPWGHWTVIRYPENRNDINMVIILDSTSEIGAHERCDLCDMICMIWGIWLARDQISSDI